MSSNDEPGQCSVDDSVPVAKQALAQKRNVRDLNTRLEMYVRAQSDKSRTIKSLKEALARNELEYSTKFKDAQSAFNQKVEKLKKENEEYLYETQRIQQELFNANNKKKEFEDRLIVSESCNAGLVSECENLRNDVKRTKDELDAFRKQYASIKYKFESYEQERNSFGDKMNKLQTKNDQLSLKLTQIENAHNSEKEMFGKVIVQKNDEIDTKNKQLQHLQLESNQTQSRLRKEFDNKLAEFVQKREEQYKQEKDEWMRIFKEEFNRKLRSFKEANQELSHSNNKQLEEINNLRTRISKLKQQKTELEVVARNNEEELERLRTDLDEMRMKNEQEMKIKNNQLLAARDRFKAKEIMYDELAGIKLQLDSEIELYRNILNEAEQESGYQSPLALKKLTNGGTRNSRKRKRLNNEYGTMTPMGPQEVESSNNSNNSKIVQTPGVARASQIAMNDLKALRDDDGDEDMEDDEMKDREEDELSLLSQITPGIEGSELQFSSLDLNKGMIEIQNIGEHKVSLNGYALSNISGTMQFELPRNMELGTKETLRIYVGEELYREIVGEDEEEKDGNKEILGDYKGAYVCWGRDVWTGKERDCARLYNPAQDEVARIEISPDMVDKAAKHGCFVM